MSLLCFYIFVRDLLTYRKLKRAISAGVHGQRISAENLQDVLNDVQPVSETDGSNSSLRVVSHSLIARVRVTIVDHSLVRSARKILDEKKWTKRVFLFGVEMVAQISYGFIIEHSLAIASAGATICQTGVIVLHMLGTSYAVYARSETFFYFIEFITELLYISIRTIRQGSLSVASTDYFDFLTLAVPLLLAVARLQKFTNFVLNYRKEQHQPRSVYVKALLVVFWLLVCSAGGVIISIAIYKGLHPRVPKCGSDWTRGYERQQHHGRSKVEQHDPGAQRQVWRHLQISVRCGAVSVVSGQCGAVSGRWSLVCRLGVRSKNISLVL